MFGSNFNANFGIPDFPMQGMDPQGGMFGANQPVIDPAAGAPSQQPGQPPAAGLPAAPQQPGIGQPSPMGGGVLSPGAGATPQMPGAPVASTQGTAPAAGLSSPFGKPQL